MRILFVHSGADMYGASRSLLRLSSRLVKDGHAVAAILPYEGPLRPELERCGIEVHIHTDLPVVTRIEFCGLKGIALLILRLPFSCSRIVSVVRKFRPDVIHTNTALILSPGIAARIMGIPHLWHIREFFEEFSGLWKWYQWYMSFLADKLICVSTPVADQFDERIRNRKVVVLHNGFPRDEFEAVAYERIKAFKDRFDLNGHELVGVVGRIKFGRKGQDLFVRAAALLKDRFPNARYLLIGSPFPGNEEHLEKLKRLIGELGMEHIVVYTGEVDDIKAAYASLDVSVLPSAQPEPFGGVVIESMALGKPVVGTNIGGTTEQIEDGSTGYLIDPGNPAPMAEAIGRLLEDNSLRSSMGENARRRYLALFEFEHFYGRIMALYSQQTEGRVAH